MERLPTRLETGLYRIALEALNNILKHARARRINLALQVDQAHVRLEISDDGVGFEPKRGTPSGYGLQSMRERAEQLGGSFTLQSKPKGGTTVIVEAPL